MSSVWDERKTYCRSNTHGSCMNENWSLWYLGAVAIEKVAYGSPLTTVTNFTYFCLGKYSFSLDNFRSMGFWWMKKASKALVCGIFRLAKKGVIPGHVVTHRYVRQSMCVCVCGGGYCPLNIRSKGAVSCFAGLS